MIYFACIAGGLLLFVLLAALVCFLLTFYSPKRKILGPDEYEIPPGKAYEAYREELIGWAKQVRAMPCERLEVKTPDGLILRGRYYEYQEGAITEILFHGYRGSSERDMSGAVERCFSVGHNALLVDQRASGTSDGHVITFGIRERYDAVLWAEAAVERFGKDVRLMLSGVSMGAATVMMAATERLPENVVAILADCGFSSPREIIRKVMKDLRAPIALLYPFVRLGAILYGGFDPESFSPMEAVKECKLPVIFYHGTGDRFVPAEMSERLYEACISDHKRLLLVPEAQHGLAFSVAKEGYLDALRAFAEESGF